MCSVHTNCSQTLKVRRSCTCHFHHHIVFPNLWHASQTCDPFSKHYLVWQDSTIWHILSQLLNGFFFSRGKRPMQIVGQFKCKSSFPALVQTCHIRIVELLAVHRKPSICCMSANTGCTWFHSLVQQIDSGIDKELHTLSLFHLAQIHHTKRFIGFALLSLIWRAWYLYKA